MRKFRKQLNRGLLEISVLKMIDKRNTYGYEIITSINQITNNIMELKDGTLYPILYRLEDSKYIESYWEEGESLRSKPRKYYRITSLGREYLKQSLIDYNEVVNAMSRILD